MKKLFGKKGFTLIEIVIVIVLLSILAAVAYPKYQDLRKDAHIAKDEATIGSWRAGIHIYFAKNKDFPKTIADLVSCLEGGLPTGWSTNPASGNITTTATITCEGVPGNITNKATWTYDPTDGSIKLTTPHT